MKTRIWLVSQILSVVFLSLSRGSFAAENSFGTCMRTANRFEHRIDRMENIRNCFETEKKNLTAETCLAVVNQKIRDKYTTRFEDELRSICIYETTSLASLEKCEVQADKFRSSYNHDDAIFFCFQQFQEKLSKKQCLNSAAKLIFPLKRDYLKQHCKDNYSE